MSRQLLLALIFAAAGCAGGVKVEAPSVRTQICPPAAPQLPCSAERADPKTLIELKRAWLEAQANAEACEALADAWLDWWTDCSSPD